MGRSAEDACFIHAQFFLLVQLLTVARLAVILSFVPYGGCSLVGLSCADSSSCFNSGWYAFGSLCRSLSLFVSFCSLCLIRIVLMFVGGRCKIVAGWFFNLVRCAEHCRSGGYSIKLNIHPNLNYLYCTEKFIIITTSTANSLHGITTSIKWNQPSRCFRWRQQLLLPNLEKQLETTPQPSPTVVEVIYSLGNPQIKQAEYQITRG